MGSIGFKNNIKENSLIKEFFFKQKLANKIIKEDLENGNMNSGNNIYQTLYSEYKRNNIIITDLNHMFYKCLV